MHLEDRILLKGYRISMLAISRWAAGSDCPFPFDSTIGKSCRESPLHRRRYCPYKINTQIKINISFYLNQLLASSSSQLKFYPKPAKRKMRKNPLKTRKTWVKLPFAIYRPKKGYSRELRQIELLVQKMKIKRVTGSSGTDRFDWDWGITKERYLLKKNLLMPKINT